MTNANDVIAIADLSQDVCGAIVFWRLSGEAKAVQLAMEWNKQGLDPTDLPSLPSPEVALHRAMNEVKAQRTLVRPLRAGKWAVVVERVGPEDTLTHDTVLTVNLNKADELAEYSNPAHDAVQSIDSAFHQHLAKLSQADVSSWLSKMVRDQLKATPLRDSGGVYFVPKDSVETYQAMARALSTATGHMLYTIPALRSDDAVNAVTDAISREVEDSAASMDEEVGSGGLGERALATRGERAEQLLEKVAEYEELLGRSLGKLRSNVKGLKRNVATAILALEDDDE